LTPFKNLFKTPKLRIFLFLFVLIFCLSLYIIIKSMLVL